MNQSMLAGGATQLPPTPQTYPEQEGVPLQPALVGPPAQMVPQPGVLSAPPPDSNRPTMSPLEASMQPSEAVPPHPEQEVEVNVTLDQSVRGIKATMKRWEVVHAAYLAIHQCLKGQQLPPIVRLPTGVTDEDGEAQVFELDLNAVAPAGLTEEQRLGFFRQQLGPWNNYLTQEWTRLLLKLHFYAQAGCWSLDPEAVYVNAEQVLLRDPQRFVEKAKEVYAALQAQAAQAQAPAVPISQIPTVPQ